MNNEDIGRLFRTGHQPGELSVFTERFEALARDIRVHMDVHGDDSLVQRLGTLAIHKLREAKYVTLDTIGLTLKDAPKREVPGDASIRETTGTVSEGPTEAA